MNVYNLVSTSGQVILVIESTSAEEAKAHMIRHWQELGDEGMVELFRNCTAVVA